MKRLNEFASDGPGDHATRCDKAGHARLEEGSAIEDGDCLGFRRTRRCRNLSPDSGATGFALHA
jgi:hypothetical protein